MRYHRAHGNRAGSSKFSQISEPEEQINVPLQRPPGSSSAMGFDWCYVEQMGAGGRPGALTSATNENVCRSFGGLFDAGFGSRPSAGHQT